MERQLHLLHHDTTSERTVRPVSRKLDARTRATGRQGIAKARAALQAACAAPKTDPAGPATKTSSNVRRSAA